MAGLGNLRISRKILLAPAAVMLALGVTAWVALSEARYQELSLLQLQQEVELPMQQVTDLRNLVTGFQASTYALISASVNETDTVKLKRDAESVLKRIGTMHAAGIALQRQINSLPWKGADHNVLKALASYEASAQDTIDMLQTMPSYSVIMMNDTARRFGVLRDEVNTLSSQFEEKRSEIVNASVTSTAHARQVLFATLIVSGLLSGCVAVAVGINIARPIIRLTAAMRRLSHGDMAVDVSEISAKTDEVGEMAATVQVFKDGLLEAKRLNAEKETARLREAARLRRLANATFEGLLIVRNGVVLEGNEATCRLLGYKNTDALHGCEIGRLLPPDTANAIATMTAGAPSLAAEIEAIRPDKKTIPIDMLARVIDYDGEDAVIVAMRDLTERKEAARRIHYLAFHDSLTDLPNRSLYNDRLSQSIAVAERANKHVAVLSLDLDRFKQANDILGHEGGDILLQNVATRLRSAVRPSDTVARFGGDEFAVLAPLDGGSDVVASIAQRIIDEVMAPYDIKGQKVEIGISVGIAVSPENGVSGTDLLRNSDLALYKAKSDGRGRYQFFEPGMDLKIQARRTIEQDLRHAVANNELGLNFQPIFECATGKMVSLEALMIWHHPLRGRVPAAEFISVAEEIGLIPTMGVFALKTACAEAMNWPDDYTVSVNVSPKQISQSDLVQSVLHVLERTGIAPERLDLEITESLLISDGERALKFMTRMRDLGVSISLDDFGTGYSSLSYLRRFPFNKLKIDKAFVKYLDRAKEDQEVVRAILALSHSLHLQVTAEGVETEEQLAFLQREGCDRVQGYLLSLPQPASKINDLPRHFNYRQAVHGRGAKKPIPLRA